MAVQISGNDITVPRDGSFTRNVTIGGTLTYEDVTNIDSVGLITARAGVTLTGGNITLGDSGGASDDRLVFGAGTDLSIYHDANNSYIEDGGTGALVIKANILSVRNAADNEQIAMFNEDGAADLYHNNTKRLETTTTGITVTEGNSGLSAANSNSDTLFLQSANNAGITIATPNTNTGYLTFADPDDDNVGQIIYRHGGSSANSMSVFVDANERLLIDHGGRVIVGHTTSHAIDVGHKFRVQVSGTDFPTSGISQQRFQDGSSGATLALCHSRNGTQGTHTILESNDEYGKIRFYGSDGTDFDGYGVGIVAKVDGGIGVNSTPGRLEIHTTPAGGNDAIERFRIDNRGRVTTPYQVAFCVTGSADNLDLDAGDKVAFNNIAGGGGAIGVNRTTYNSVTVFNTTSYEFTAPVAGLYLFTVSFYFRAVNGSVTTQFVLAKNGTEISHSNHYILFSVYAVEGLQPNASQILDLAAGDVITVHRRTAGQSGTSRVYMPHSYFSGCLIG